MNNKSKQNNKRRTSRRRRQNRYYFIRLIRNIAIVALVMVLIALATALVLDRLLKNEAPPERSYPMEYTDLIRENAALQGLEPAHVAAVILAESGYDPGAVSGVNAQGLMQIMPDTGAWIAGKFDEEYVEGCLFDPETNIRYGCWYLGYLLRRFDGDKTCATAAYHSGQGKVDEWLANPAYSSNGKTLDVIAGENANTYVNRVMDYYEKYVEQYAA